jgi:MarR family 2-MHQ and catechol resistance regulon transcriptional repressor
MPKIRNNIPDQTVSLFFSASRALKHKLGLDNPLSRLPMAQMEALRFVRERVSAQMKQVAEFLDITPPSATALINHLAQSGLVKRTFDRKDRRTIHLTLTKKGRAVLDKGIKQRCKIFKLMLGNLNTKEQSEFIRILKKMVRDN